jgi:hypothetical protein
VIVTSSMGAATTTGGPTIASTTLGGMISWGTPISAEEQLRRDIHRIQLEGERRESELR